MTNSSPPLLRSLLAVPATSARFLEKAAQSPADALFIDLEDAVIADLKLTARGNAIAALNQLDWGRRSVSVRVNGSTRHGAAATSLTWSRPVRGSTAFCCRNAIRRPMFTRSRS